MEGKTGKNAGNGNNRGKPALRVVSVQFTPLPGNEYRFRRLLDLLLRPVALEAGNENEKAEQGKGTEGEDTPCE